MMRFQQELLADIQAEMEKAILKEHWDALAADKETTPLNVDWPQYLTIEKAGMLDLTTARTETGELVGYWLYILGLNLHRMGVKFAESSAFWLAPEHRKFGAGVQLLRAGEQSVIAKGYYRIVNKAKLHYKPKGKRDIGLMFIHEGYRPLETIYIKTIGGQDGL